MKRLQTTKIFATLFAFAILSLGASAVQASELALQAYPGWDSLGGDFEEIPTGNGANCSQACLEKGNCTAAVFVSATGRCWLKSSIAGQYSQLSGATLYLKMLAGRGGVDYPGGDYRSYETNSWQSCSRDCYASSQCKAYTYVTQSRTCWLKDRIVDANFLDGAISGRR